VYMRICASACACLRACVCGVYVCVSCVCVCVDPIDSLRVHFQRGGLLARRLLFGLYTILSSPILYGSRHTKGGSVRGRILPNGRVIVLQ